MRRGHLGGPDPALPPARLLPGV